MTPDSPFTPGNAAGLGAVRVKELSAALPALLGSRAGSVTVVDHPGLQVRESEDGGREKAEGWGAPLFFLFHRTFRSSPAPFPSMGLAVKFRARVNTQAPLLAGGMRPGWRLGGLFTAPRPPLVVAVPRFFQSRWWAHIFFPFQDGMHTAWDTRAAADAITAALHARPGTTTLLSFDGGGVTGHPNHAATAAAAATVAAAAGPAVTAWRLRSLPWHLAWLGPAALVVVPALSGRAGRGRRVVLAARTGPAAVLAGLVAHASQRTWWRVLGALVRSASYVSVLEPM